jgi:HEAT repeat protein
VILEERQSEASARRAAELADLAGTREAGSLNTILSELSNRDARIRQAAVAAAVEFGDRGAIPALREAMESNPDPQEKVNLQKAITYLQLPTLTEAGMGLGAGAQPSVHSGAGE